MCEVKVEGDGEARRLRQQRPKVGLGGREGERMMEQLLVLLKVSGSKERKVRYIARGITRW